MSAPLDRGGHLSELALDVYRYDVGPHPEIESHLSACDACRAMSCLSQARGQPVGRDGGDARDVDHARIPGSLRPRVNRATVRCRC